MYALASHLITLPVISLQTGETIATVSSLIMDPGNLRLIGFHLNVGRSTRNLLVMPSVRQLALDCVIVDNDDELSEPDDVVRLVKLIKDNYNPLGKRVQSDLGRQLGSVEDYTINLETEQLQKIYVRPPMIKAWYRSSLVIDRAQIIDVQPARFIVRDTHDFTTLAVKASSTEPS